MKCATFMHKVAVAEIELDDATGFIQKNRRFTHRSISLWAFRYAVVADRTAF